MELQALGGATVVTDFLIVQVSPTICSSSVVNMIHLLIMFLIAEWHTDSLLTIRFAMRRTARNAVSKIKNMVY